MTAWVTSGPELKAGVSKATIWQRLRDECGLPALSASLKRLHRGQPSREGQRSLESDGAAH